MRPQHDDRDHQAGGHHRDLTASPPGDEAAALQRAEPVLRPVSHRRRAATAGSGPGRRARRRALRRRGPAAAAGRGRPTAAGARVGPARPPAPGRVAAGTAGRAGRATSALRRRWPVPAPPAPTRRASGRPLLGLRPARWSPSRRSARAGAPVTPGRGRRPPPSAGPRAQRAGRAGGRPPAGGRHPTPPSAAGGAA